MDGFSVNSLTSLCTSIINRTASSAAELDPLVRSAGTATTLQTHRDYLTKLSNETVQLEQVLRNATTISQTLQEALKSVLKTGDTAVGKLHKQLMRLQPQNVHLLDEDYIAKYDEFLIAYAQMFRFLTEVLSATDRAEQDARLMALGQQRLRDAETAFTNATQATNILGYESSSEKGPNMNNMPLRPKGQQADADMDMDMDNDTGNQPPPYIASAPSASPGAAQAGPSSSPGPFAPFAKSFKAFTSHFISKPDPFVSALCQAILNGDTQQVSGLLGQGANVNGRNEEGNTAMQCAVLSDNESVLPLLLAAGANPKGSGWSGLPPLFQAASMGKLRVAKVLIERGANVNEESMTGQSYFVDVCGSGNLEGIEFLLQYGAKATSETVSGRPVLVQAVRKDNMDLVKLLLKFGAKAATSDITGSSVLALAMEKKDITMATLLLDHGAKPDSSTVYGNTVLADAISKGRLDMAKLLLQRGAKGNDSNLYGQPLLIMAIKDTKMSAADKTDLIQRLLQNGADANATDSGWTTSAGAICYALDGPSSSPEILSLLLRHGAKPNNHEMSNGETLLLYAMDKGKTEEARQLLSHGATPNTADKQGRLPLMQAVLTQDLEMVKLLKQHGAKVDVKGTVSVADFARALNRPELLDMLGLKASK